MILPSHSSLVSTSVTGSLFVPLRLALDLALFCSALVFLVELWGFSAPGLYRRERNEAFLFFMMSFVLFGGGVLFSFYLILPFFFELIINAAPSGVQFMPDITHAIDFIMNIFLIFGFCFQVPLLTIVMVRFGWMRIETLRKIRPYVIVLAFVVGMLLTPPDVLSQVMLALPLWILYEIGLLFARFLR